MAAVIVGCASNEDGSPDPEVAPDAFVDEDASGSSPDVDGSNSADVQANDTSETAIPDIAADANERDGRDARVVRPECTEDSECDDGIDCTVDSCNAFIGECTHIPTDNTCCVDASDCQDASDCTADLCVANRCAFPRLPLDDCECTADFFCDDQNPCTSDTCTDGTCAYAATPNADLGCGTCAYVDGDECCQSATDCDDGSDATTDHCVAERCVHSLASVDVCAEGSECQELACGGGTCLLDLGVCTYAPTTDPAGPEGCCSTTADCGPAAECTTVTCEAFECLTEATFESTVIWQTQWSSGELEGWTVESDGSGAMWQISDQQAISAPYSLYYGSLRSGNFDVGATTGSATSPPIELVQKQATFLEFWIAPFVESMLSVDQVRIELLVEGETYVLWSKGDGGGTITGWQSVTRPLGMFVADAPAFRLRVVFDSVDEVKNDKPGIYLDDVRIVVPCGTLPP